MRRSSLLLSLLLLGVAASTITACSLRQRGDPCYDSGDCDADPGEVKACIAGRCESVDCNTSSDCPMGEICDVDGNDCEEGCNTDLDCLAGSRCDDGECVDYGCRSTILDCDFGEYCDEDSGSCVPADNAFCAECNTASNDYDNLGTTTTCDDVLLGNDFCGGAGNYCIDWYFSGSSGCLIACDEEEDCPAGSQCTMSVRPLPGACGEDFLQLTTVCLADCSQLQQ